MKTSHILLAIAAGAAFAYFWNTFPLFYCSPWSNVEQLAAGQGMGTFNLAFGPAT